MEIGGVYSHRENNMSVVVKNIEHTPRGTIVWFVFDGNDPCSTWYCRSDIEFKLKFKVSINRDMRSTLDRMIATYGVKEVLNYVGDKYKESIL